MRLLTALRRVLLPSTRSRGAADVRLIDSDASPGRSGPSATVEVDPRRLRGVSVRYAPEADREPDPGEIVWTWVPYEEGDGRGKDRPVVIVASEPGETFLAAQLTSQPRSGRRDYLALGTGAWDPHGRPSWIDLDRIFRVHPAGVRREAATLDAERFARIAEALARRYGWG